MIRYNPKTWFGQIFLFHRSDTLRILWQEMLIMGIYSGILTWIITVNFPDHQHFKNTLSVHSLVGFVMGLFLVFRTNTAYDRWWEGRKLWGSLVNVSRNLSIKLNAFVKNDSPEKKEIIQLLSFFPFAVKEHLRNQQQVSFDQFELSREIREELIQADHLPNAIVQIIYGRLKEISKRQEITAEEMLILDKELSELLNIVGGCERIRSTPIPYSYSLFMKKFIFIYTVTIPIGLIPDFIYWTIPITMFIFYVMVSLEILAEEIEDPFGTDDNDLPTDEIAEKIALNIQEIETKKRGSV
ncbi:MAG: hypothetical protein K1X56_05340 [Flavobacteriales bacterium]|nr:hypothetical protein [Flavobacteriales bacterium]